MTETFDIEQFIEHYIKNIRAMQQLTDTQIHKVMLLKIEKNPEYFEIISDVSKKVDNNKLIRQVLENRPQSLQTANTEPEKYIGRKIA